MRRRERRIRTDVAVLFVGDEAERRALLRGEPDLFSDPGYEGWPLALLHLDRVDRLWLEELVTDAWRMRTGEGWPCSRPARRPSRVSAPAAAQQRAPRATARCRSATGR